MYCTSTRTCGDMLSLSGHVFLFTCFMEHDVSTMACKVLGHGVQHGVPVGHTV